MVNIVWERMVEFFWTWSNLVWLYWSVLTLMAMIELCGNAIGSVGAMGWFGLTVVVPCLEMFVVVYAVSHKFTGTRNCCSGDRPVEFETNHPVLIQWLIVSVSTLFASVMWLSTAATLSQDYLHQIESAQRYDANGSASIPTVVQVRWAMNNLFVVLAWVAISMSNLLVQAYSHAKERYTYQSM